MPSGTHRAVDGGRYEDSSGADAEKRASTEARFSRRMRDAYGVVSRQTTNPTKLRSSAVGFLTINSHSCGAGVSAELLTTFSSELIW